MSVVHNNVAHCFKFNKKNLMGKFAKVIFRQSERRKNKRLIIT